MTKTEMIAEAILRLKGKGDMKKVTMTDIGLYVEYDRCQVLNDHGHLTVMWDDKAVEVR